VRVLVAVDGHRGRELADGIAREGIEIAGTVASTALADIAADLLPEDAAAELAAALAASDTLVLEAGRSSLTEGAVSLCDRRGVRIIPLATGSDARLVESFGLAGPWSPDIEPWRLVDLILSGAVGETLPAPHAPDGRPAVIAVWGPGGAPGRTTLAIELAVELARGGRHVGLVDADTHAPSLALQLGLADEGPGFAAACRQAELSGLDARELTRISTPIAGTGVDVLTGINRPSRWPELTDTRVAAALDACRGWADHTVIDVAASLERDEEIVSDLDGPRRNAATLAALQAADLVVAVASADPVGISRFVRAHAELRAIVGATPVAVVANRLRPGTLGVDARGQVRRTLDRFAGIRDLWFVPADARSVDAAILAARPIAEVAPKSPFTLAIRRFVGDAVVPAPAAMPKAAGRGIRRLSRRAA
jgi:MinD-like ATPase involved in chromosome partitioning or flagellar assembly